jgi:methyl-accepting chemotaxis protein
MKWTIRTRLFGLTLSGLLVVACVSATGYWGVTSVRKTTGEVAAIGVAIRNHLEAGMFNDMTRDDIDAVCTKKGQDQQDAVANLGAHADLLTQHTVAARKAAPDAATASLLDNENKLVREYVSATDSLAKTVVRDPSHAAAEVGHGIQLYTNLQQQFRDDSDALEDSVKAAELRADSKSASATRATFLICGVSLLLLLTIATRITLSIVRPLDAFSAKFKAMAETNDLTARVDQDRQDEIGELGQCLNLFVEKVHNILTQIVEAAQTVEGSSAQLFSTSQQIAANSEVTSAQAKVVSDSAAHVSQNLQTVAGGAEEMGACIREVARNAAEAAKVATSAVKVAQTTTATVSRLGESSTGIGQAGIGQSPAGGDMGRKIEAIQADAKSAIAAIANISDVIGQVNGISNTIAAAMEEQNATTNEMARNVNEAARRSGEITSNIAGVARAAESTSQGASDTQKAAQQLVETSSELRRLVEQFKIDIRGSSKVAQSSAVRSMAARAGR